MMQFGQAPAKSLGETSRERIAQLLKRQPNELKGLFHALDEIITANSTEAQPLAAADRLSKVRAELGVLRTHADDLQAKLGKLDPQLLLRLILGSMMTGPNNERPLGDFSKDLKRFRNLLQTIDEALAPPRGDRARVDRLRTVTYLCAIQYRAAAGKLPARRTGGVFHQLMNIVLGEIGLELPVDPYNILKPAIDAAENAPPEQTPSL